MQGPSDARPAARSRDLVIEVTLRIESDDIVVGETSGLSSPEVLFSELNAILDEGGTESGMIMRVAKHLYENYSLDPWQVRLNWVDGERNVLKSGVILHFMVSETPPVTRVSRYERKPVI
jgi:hypothetical protein